jgi:glycosyltransferase involved in cell wall biosynthesis
MVSDPNSQLKIVLVTDVFPPGSGGSGWSTFYLGKALSERGHQVSVLRPRYDLLAGRPALRRTQFGGLVVEELIVPGPPDWTRRAGLQRAWQEREAARHLGRRATQIALRRGIDILHGQHKVSTLAVAAALDRARARGAHVAAVSTVRDYWPLCPVSTRLFNRRDGGRFECKECHQFSDYMASVLAEGRHSLPEFLISQARWLATRQAARRLASCDAVIAVSRYVRDELALSGRVPGERLYNIPNLVDLPSVDRDLGGEWPLHDISLESRFALFVGKLDVNKGAGMLPDAMVRSGISMPVVLLGDGPIKEEIESDARRRGLDFRFYSWLDNDAVLRVMKAARLLLFPSAWQEPLSRVLLEASATGAAICALDTGGTSDVIVDGQSGLLAPDMASFVAGIKRLAGDDALNQALRAGARARAERVFAAPKVAGEMETLYRALVGRTKDERRKTKDEDASSVLDTRRQETGVR